MKIYLCFSTIFQNKMIRISDVFFIFTKKSDNVQTKKFGKLRKRQAKLILFTS